MEPTLPRRHFDPSQASTTMVVTGDNPRQRRQTTDRLNIEALGASNVSARWRHDPDLQRYTLDVLPEIFVIFSKKLRSIIRVTRRRQRDQAFTDAAEKRLEQDAREVQDRLDMATPMTLDRILAETAEKRAAVREALSKFGASLTGDDSDEDDQDDESGSQQGLNIVVTDVGFASGPEYEADGVADEDSLPGLCPVDIDQVQGEGTESLDGALLRIRDRRLDSARILCEETDSSHPRCPLCPSDPTASDEVKSLVWKPSTLAKHVTKYHGVYASTQRWLQSRDVSLATANGAKIPCAFKEECPKFQTTHPSVLYTHLIDYHAEDLPANIYNALREKDAPLNAAGLTLLRVLV